MGLISSYFTKTTFYNNTENLFVLWLTNPEAIKFLLPPPLELAELPLVVTSISSFPDTTLGTPCKMASLFVACQYKGDV